MPIGSSPPSGRPASAADFVMWWLPEFVASAGCVCAGLLLWGPLAAAAVIPMLRPAVEAAQLVGQARQDAEHERARLEAAAVLADLQRPALPPVVAVAERLDRPEIGQVER